MNLEQRPINQGHLKPVVPIIPVGGNSLAVKTAVDGDLSSLIQGRYDSDPADIADIRIDASTLAMKTIEYEHSEIHSARHYFIEGHVTLADAGVMYAKLVTPNTAKWSHFLWKIQSSGILDTKFYEIPTGGMAGGARNTIHASNRNGNCWSGRQDGGNNKAILTDSTQAWTVDALIGMQVFNQTDGSSAFITDNDATTVTATLAGGTDSDWDDNDVYEINNSQMVVTSAITVATSLGLLLSDNAVGGTGFKGDVGGMSERTNELVLKQNTTYLRSFLSGSDANVISFRASWYELQNIA